MIITTIIIMIMIIMIMMPFPAGPSPSLGAVPAHPRAAKGSGPPHALGPARGGGLVLSARRAVATSLPKWPSFFYLLGEPPKWAQVFQCP